jgi:hypothetical protein
VIISPFDLARVLSNLGAELLDVTVQCIPKFHDQVLVVGSGKDLRAQITDSIFHSTQWRPCIQTMQWRTDSIV